jgi:hypothetical protein
LDLVVRSKGSRFGKRLRGVPIIIAHIYPSRITTQIGRRRVIGVFGVNLIALQSGRKFVLLVVLYICTFSCRIFVATFRGRHFPRYLWHSRPRLLNLSQFAFRKDVFETYVQLRPQPCHQLGRASHSLQPAQLALRDLIKALST